MDKVIQDMIKGVVFDVIVKKVIARAVTALPFLGVPPFSWVFGYAVNKIATMFYEELARRVTFALIDAQVEGQRQAYDEAVGKLKEVIAAPPEKFATEEERNAAAEQARLEMEKRLRDLIHFDL